ncbi:MAG: MBL fold metallo-hydrolase RNA specificity domain-containing protein [Roseimicrobium sp.]
MAFVGYTDPETPGFRVRHAKPNEKITLDSKLPPVELRCRVESFDFSAHAVREDIVAYVKSVNAPKVLLVHGDSPAQEWFLKAIAQASPQSEVLTPEPSQQVILWS